jgi:mitotic spindle assembly checkpoint protein MAD2
MSVAPRRSKGDAPTRSNLPLRGSAKYVAEFFGMRTGFFALQPLILEYSINSILYQRGIYPSEDFQVVRKYDLNMLVTTDSEVKAYIKKIMGQLHSRSRVCLWYPVLT